MLVDREAKISSFQKEKYHIVQIAAGGMEAASERMGNADDAKALKDACETAQAVCVSVTRERKTEQPPRLYDLTTLQREANRLFGFTAKQTLDYAQQLYEKKLLTYPRTDSQYLTDDMLPTAESLVSGLWPMLSFAAGLDLSPQFGRVLNSKKVSDHHAIVPTMEFVQKGFDGLAEGEKKLLSLVCCKLLCAVAAPHVYEAVTATFTCAGNTFTAKGKTILTPGWKELDRRFKASFKTDADDTTPEPARELPEITEGQTFDKVTAAVTEHFTAPPKSYTEDTLLSAMERAGADDLPEDAERQGLGTPATRASILEKLVQMGFVERRGKQLLPTKDGHNLACVLPEALTSPQLTAQWETELTAIAKGHALLEVRDKGGLETFEAALVLGNHTRSVKDLINLTQNLDLYRFYPDISDDEGLGRLYADELGTIDIPEYIQNYFDYEAYGRDVRINEGGVFAPGGYIKSNKIHSV